MSDAEIVDDVMGTLSYPEIEKPVYCVMTTRDWQPEGQQKPEVYCVVAYTNYESAYTWIHGNMSKYYWICRTTIVD